MEQQHDTAESVTSVDLAQDTPDTGETGSEPAVEQDPQPVIESLGSAYSTPAPEASTNPFSGL